MAARRTPKVLTGCMAGRLVKWINGSRFSAAERKALSVAPEFPAGAKVSVSRGMGKNRRGEAVEQVTVRFPVVGPEAIRQRAFDYVVRALRRDGSLLKEKRVYSPGINMPPEKDAKEAICVFSVSELSPGDMRFTVAPANCWRVEGRAAAATFKV